MTTLIVLSPLLLSLLAVPVTVLAGLSRTHWAPRTGIFMAGLTFAATIGAWRTGGGSITVPWAPSWDLYLSFKLDGLSALYSLLASGIGILVLWYSQAYIPHHLSSEGQPQNRILYFYALLLSFMASMIGLVMSQDLLLLFVFWEFTTIASYLLIGFDSHKEESRRAALMALLVTGITSLFFLIGALVLHAEYKTFFLPELFREAEPGSSLTGAVGLIVLAALVKSAQVPFHFWLPRAMAAPTPVSAYLHSAAMVAAGVFLISRIYPLVHSSRLILDTLVVIGLLSMGMGGLFALKETVLKRILAYSTVAQYGYIVLLLGLGTAHGVIGASFYVLAHALMKSGLFLTAGAVMQATGENQIQSLGGLARSMPWLAAGSGIIAAGLAGLPLTMGFFKDEILFRAVLERGTWLAIAVVLNAALTLAYTWRFWSGIFLGNARTAAHHIPTQLIIPIVFLGGLVLIGGLWWGPFNNQAGAAASAAWGGPVSMELAYHLDARSENIMALLVYFLGALLILIRPVLRPFLSGLSRAGDRAGPEHAYTAAARLIDRGSAFIYNFELHDLANRITTILIPTAGLILIGLWVTPASGAYRVSALDLEDLPTTLMLLLTALSAFVVAVPKNHLTQVMLLSSVNFALAGVFAFIGAPNLALVVVLIGVVSTLIFVAFFTLIPDEVLQQAESVRIPTSLIRKERLIGFLAGGGAFLVVWRVLSYPSFEENVASKYMDLAPAAHAKDVVTAILADWRGLDTMGEVTVLAIILVGIGSLLQFRMRQ